MNHILFALKVEGSFFLFCVCQIIPGIQMYATRKVSEGSKCTTQYYNIALCYANYFFPAAPAMSASPTYQTGTKPLGKPAAARSLTSELERPGAATALAPAHKAER